MKQQRVHASFSILLILLKCNRLLLDLVCAVFVTGIFPVVAHQWAHPILQPPVLPPKQKKGEADGEMFPSFDFD